MAAAGGAAAGASGGVPAGGGPAGGGAAGGPREPPFVRRSRELGAQRGLTVYGTADRALISTALRNPALSPAERAHLRALHTQS